MKYSPGLPEKNSNASAEHPLKEFFILLLGAISVLLAVLLLLGLFVDTAVRYIDPELESELFDGFTGDEESSPTEQEQELQSLLDRLGKCIDVGYPVIVRVSESAQMNAFAMPGGRIVILSEMLDKLQTENGLAFVLAHELGHYKNRDHLRGLGRSIVLLTVSVLLTGANSDISALLTPVYSAEMARYSQDRESEADSVALHALNCHYGHVGGATEFFNLVAETEQSEDWSLTHYFTSHPEARKRIDDLDALAKSLGYSIQEPE